MGQVQLSLHFCRNRYLEFMKNAFIACLYNFFHLPKNSLLSL